MKTVQNCIIQKGILSTVRIVEKNLYNYRKETRNSETSVLGDTAMNLGSAMDELMRHQPTLKTDAMKAIIQVL